MQRYRSSPKRVDFRFVVPLLFISSHLAKKDRNTTSLKKESNHDLLFSRNWRSPPVLNAQPALLLIICVGCSVGSIPILLLTFDDHQYAHLNVGSSDSTVLCLAACEDSVPWSRSP